MKPKITLRKKKKRPLVSTKRSANYGLNPTVAAKARKHSIDAYRKTRGKEFELSGSTVLRSLDFIDVEPIELPVMNVLTNKLERHPVIRLTHAAKLFNISYQTLWRWMSETNQFPEPVLVDNSQGREYTVYHVEEMRVMIRIIGEHLQQFKYYRKDHTATRDKLFEAVRAVRGTYLTKTSTKGNTPHGTQAHRKSTRIRKKGS